MTLRKLTATTFEEVTPLEEVKEAILAEEFPKQKTTRILTLLGIAHLTFLVMIFTTIVVVRYALQL